MATLYEITDDWQTVVNFEVETEEDLEALNQLLAETEGRFEDKARKVAAYIRNIETDADGIKEEEDRLATRRKSLSRKIDGLKDYLEVQMKAIGSTKMDLQLFTISIQKNPPAVKVLDEARIPPEFWKVPAPVLDKTALKEALKAGYVEGAMLVQGESLRIK